MTANTHTITFSVHVESTQNILRGIKITIDPENRRKTMFRVKTVNFKYRAFHGWIIIEIPVGHNSLTSLTL